MSTALQMPSERTIQTARSLSERALSVEEFQAAADAPLGPDEREAYIELLDWFSRRYPTPAERLTYIRRAVAQIAHAPSRPTSAI